MACRQQPEVTVAGDQHERVVRGHVGLGQRDVRPLPAGVHELLRAVRERQPVERRRRARSP